MKKKGIIYLVIIVVIIFGGAIITVKTNQYKQRVTFTQEKWVAEPNKRFVIVKDMIKKHNFDNMTKEDVINLLGEPDNKGKADGFARGISNRKKTVDLNNSNSICYFTKTGQMPEDFNGFYIMLDNNGKVSDYAIIHFTT
ncbi:MAG: hypothetical protein ACREV6_12830 [Clostridium sp.]|uniref:hypothetical protein n=1 Tax=Clostridium sp. TaxID=1506 RepID=UPI003D6CA61B